MKPTIHQPQANHPRRYDNLGAVIWMPLPKYILDNIFHFQMRDTVLGSLGKDLGEILDWDPATGICTLHDSGSFRILLSKQEGIHKMFSYLNEFGNVWNVIEGLTNSSFENTKKKLELLAQTLAANIAIAEPYEFFVGRLGINEFKERHFSDPATHNLVEEYSTVAGSIRVKSVPLPSAPHGLPASHPELAKMSLIQERTKSVGNVQSPVLAESRAILGSLFATSEPGTKERFGVDSRADSKVDNLNRNLVNQEGTISVLPEGDTKQTPVVEMGNDRFVNTAATIQDGTIKKSTLDGYARNANPGYPSSYFHPHPDWNNSVLAGPRILSDFKSIAILIGIAVILQSDNDSYSTIYKNTTKVIDNQKADSYLFGG
jgi:hypothetical protein